MGTCVTTSPVETVLTQTEGIMQGSVDHTLLRKASSSALISQLLLDYEIGRTGCGCSFRNSSALQTEGFKCKKAAHEQVL